MRAATGEIVAKKSLKRAGEVLLATSNGMVILSDSQGLHAHRHQGGRFGSSWKARGDVQLPLLVHQGRLITSLRGTITIRDARTGKVLATGDGGRGMLGISEGDPPEIVGVKVREYGDEDGSLMELVRVTVAGLSTKKPRLLRFKADPVGYWTGSTDDDLMRKVSLVRIPRPEPAKRGSWMVTSSRPFRAASESLLPSTVLQDGDEAGGGLCEIASAAAVHGGRAHGFSKDGTLISVEPDGRYLPLVEAKDFPRGARPGPATTARGVLILGNWAVEYESGRVLWSLPDLRPVTPAIPAGDGLIVVVTEGGELICLADPVIRKAADAAKSEPSGGQPRRLAGLPADADGVLLVDGRQLRWPFEKLPDGRLRLTTREGKPLIVPESDVALAEKDGEIVLRAGEDIVFSTLRGVLDGIFLDSLEGIFEAYAKTGLHSDCRRLLDEAREHGLDDAGSEQLNRRLVGRRESPSTTQIRKNLARKEKAFRGKVSLAYLEGSDGCRKREMNGAATALLAIADRVHPGQKEVEKRAADLVPPGFPWPKDAAAGRRWLAWAEAIVPAGGEFLSPKDPAWSRIKRASWGKGTLGFRTRNLLLFSRAHDIEAVGACLRYGEGTIRALDLLLHGGRASAVESDRNRLEVRVYKNEKEYRSERQGVTEHTAGYYSPGEEVSRFFVPREYGTDEPLGRNLFSVLSHELTHQFIEERWHVGRRGSGLKTPGYWIVEGMARFVQDQALEMGRRGLRFDDETVRSLDISAQLTKQGRLIPLRRFIGINYERFVDLGLRPSVTVEPRNTLGTFRLAEIHIFYEQAGSLVFYLLQKAGPDRRKALIEYVRSYYLGRTGGTSWEELGYKAVEDLEKDYREFLSSLLQ